MKTLACAWFPITKADRDPNLTQALRLANRVIFDRELDVVNVEVVTEGGGLDGRRKP